MQRAPQQERYFEGVTFWRRGIRYLATSAGRRCSDRTSLLHFESLARKRPADLLLTAVGRRSNPGACFYHRHVRRLLPRRGKCGNKSLGRTIMLAFRNSPSEISLVLGPSDAKWLSDEMSFLAELYRSKTSSSARQFGGDNNVAAASFWETALKCQRLSVALQQAVSRDQRWEDAGRDQVLPAIDPPQQALVSPSPANSSASERQTRPKRVRRTAKEGAVKKKKGSKSPK